MINQKQIITHKTFYSLLGISLLFFLIKGVQYALIGSYVPILFILLFILLLVGFRSSHGRFKKTVKGWAIVLIIWALSRLVVEIGFYFTPSLTETHIREQFTVYQNLITLFFLFSSIYMSRYLKKLTL